MIEIYNSYCEDEDYRKQRDLTNPSSSIIHISPMFPCIRVYQFNAIRLLGYIPKIGDRLSPSNYRLAFIANSNGVYKVVNVVEKNDGNIAVIISNKDFEMSCGGELYIGELLKEMPNYTETPVLE